MENLKEQQLNEIFAEIQKRKKLIEIGFILIFISTLASFFLIINRFDLDLILLGLCSVIISVLFTYRQVNKLLVSRMLEKAMRLFYWKNDIE
jgi:1,4-dihydroxy-2-naphthoate octaprenyltransferase